MAVIINLGCINRMPDSIQVITFNLAENPTQPNLLIRGEPDILVICTQEQNTIKDPILPLISSSVLDKYELLKSEQLNRASKKNIAINLYVKKSWVITHMPDATTGKHALMAKDPGGFGLGRIGLAFQGAAGNYSKGAVWITLKLKDYSVTFVNMHGTMDSGKPGLGFEPRKTAFIEVMNALKGIASSSHIILTGDLNFRIDKEGDQLERVLRGPLPFPIYDVSVGQEYQQYTCKFVNHPTVTDACRLQDVLPEGPANKSCFSLEGNLDMNSKNHEIRVDKKEHREPSRCDRVLAYSPPGIPTNLMLTSYTTDPPPASLKTIGDPLDHNVVSANFTIQPLVARNAAHSVMPSVANARNARWNHRRVANKWNMRQHLPSYQGRRLENNFSKPNNNVKTIVSPFARMANTRRSSMSSTGTGDPAEVVEGGKRRRRGRTQKRRLHRTKKRRA